MAVGIATAFCAQVLLAAEQADQTQGEQFRQTKNSPAETPGLSGDGIRISKLKGADVKSKSGEDLGKLEDLVVDRRTGQITFAIIGKGRLLGLGEKRRPIPWQDVTIDSDQQVTLNVNKQKLKSAPTVTSDYSELNDPANVLVIYRFYEIQPAGAPGSTPGGTEERSGEASPKPNSSNP